MKIAIVEDDFNMRQSLLLALSDEFDLHAFKHPIEALEKLDDSFEVIISDINMPKMNGIEFIEAAKKANITAEFIIITGNATLNKAIEALRLDVRDFLTKPFELEELSEAIKNAAKFREKSKNLKIKKTSRKKIVNDGFLANSSELERLKQIALKAAKTNACVFLSGESGVGKEVFANFIHKNSPRAKEKFLAINMAALPSNLIESELFGYEKGAFTDAAATKIGLFELASGGTLFLDEIGEMQSELQAKLLRVLQEKKITRLGGVKEIPIDVRIISASNIDIDEAIENKKMRADLFYRLNTIMLEISPLRHRRDEIIPLAQEILKRSQKEFALDEKSLSDEACKALLGYHFPGNIRELISIIESAAILSDDKEIKASDLRLNFKSKNKLINLELQLISEALASESDPMKACKLIGMKEEEFLKKIKLYNLEEK